MRRARAHERARAGFTLLELMVAMTAGLLTIAAAYYLGSLSARAFHGQMRTSEMQGTLRAAMEQLARDIPRAGFLATADSNRLADCAGGLGSVGGTDGVVPDQRLFGVRVAAMQDAVKAALGSPDRNLTRADSLTLVGNYETGEIYAVASDNLGGDTVRLESTREGFRRSFFTPAVGAALGTFSLSRFREVFAAGRLVRIDTDNRVFFRRVVQANADATGDNATVTFTPQLSEACFKRATALITPVSMIRYSFEPVLASDTRFKRLASSSGYPGAQRVALVRSELNPASPTNELGNSLRVVLDYAVELQVDAVIDDNPGGVPKYVVLTDATSPTVYEAEPVNFRALRVTLSTRTEDLDPRWTPPPMRTKLSDPLLSFGMPVTGAGVLHARVRTLHQEFRLPNL